MKQLFKLLQLGLQITDVKDIDTSEFASLSKEEWTAIKDMAVKQGVSAIVLDGINQLPLAGYNLPAEMKLEWIGEALQIEQRNRQQVEVMNDLAGKWKINGCRVMIMKGQANGTMYPKPEHRSPGDIDCYLFNCNINPNDNLNDDKEAYRIGNDIARATGAKVDESWYKHSVISYKGETFENHQFFVHTRDGKRGKMLNQELVEQLRVEGLEFRELPAAPAIVIPPVQWTAMFLTYHACAHFISEGLRLKQILDWAMFLDKHQNDVDWEAFWGFCERNHLRVFERIMKSALYDEDYVFNSGKSGWANRIHLVRNMFRYRWKYEEVYQTSVWKQLWWYASGYLLRTE